jgi:hypothetical protein
MGSLLQDRLSAILFYIEQWRDSDPNLEHKDGFLNYLTTCDIGQFNEGNTQIWMNYQKEAKKKGVTIPEILFEKQRLILSLEPRSDKKPIEERVFVLSQESKNDLAEMEERLKLQDPLRRKQVEKQ